MTTSIDVARERGKQRAREYLYGLHLALGDWPREWANTPDAERGYDQMTMRLGKKAA